MKLCDENQCTGCGGCYASCAFGCIQMLEDCFGMLKPQIDTEKCRECGKCRKACPVLNNTKKNYPTQCFALYTKHTMDRKTCSSGGIATAIGRLVLKEGGVVFGCDYDNTSQLTYKKAETEEELELFKGSKYVYSFPDRIYNTVKQELNNGKQCLFVGVPCQIDGLKQFLGKDFENLITIDLICHGTPPMNYLQEHIAPFLYKKKREPFRVTFRGKEDFKLTVFDENGKKVYSRKQDEDVYFLSFLQGLTYREICYSCPYAQSNRISDITIGDFWGLDKHALKGYKGKISVALINTPKGKMIFEALKPYIEFEERDIGEAISGNAQLQEPSRYHPERKTFLNLYPKVGFKKAMASTSIPKQVRKQRIRNIILLPYRTIRKLILRIFSKGCIGE